MSFFRHRGGPPARGGCPRRRRTRDHDLLVAVAYDPPNNATARKVARHKTYALPLHPLRVDWSSVASHWVFLGGSSMVLRCVFIHRSPYRLRELSLPLGHGALQDGVVILQAVTAMTLLRLRFGPRSWIAALGAVFCNGVPFMDALLQMERLPRLCWGFVVNFCLNFRMVYPSFVAALSWQAAALLLAWAVYVALGASRLSTCARETVTRRRVRGIGPVALVVATCLGWVACLLSHQKQNSSMMYYVDNSVFKLQREPWSEIIDGQRNRGWRRTKSVLEELIVAATEIYTVPAPVDRAAYPTLRKTLGYRGPKLFDVDVSGQQQPNVLLLMMESWKDLGSLGPDARRVITPEFDKLRAGGISFDAHYTPSVQTSRSLLVSLFGNLPEHEEEPAIGKYPDLNLVGLPHFLTAKGYHNEFISATNLAWDKWNTRLLRHGFDTLMDNHDILELLADKGYPSGEEEKEGLWGLWDEKGFDGLYERMVELQATDTKAFINFYSVTSHWPFGIVPDNFVIRDFAPYDETESIDYLASVSYADQQLGRFIAKCRDAGLLNDTIVLIQGDHGSSFSQQVMPMGVREAPAHIPALLLADGRLPADQRGTALARLSSQTDVFATLADILGVPPGGTWNHGLGSSMVRAQPAKVAVLENPFEGKALGARRGDLKVVQWGRAPQVFNISADPFEERPLATYDAAATTALLDGARETVDLYSSLYRRNGFAPEDLTILDP